MNEIDIIINDPPVIIGNFMWIYPLKHWLFMIKLLIYITIHKSALGNISITNATCKFNW
jgi:hypothetical protein